MSNVIKFPTKEQANPKLAELDKEIDKLLERFTKEEIAISMMRLMGESYEETVDDSE
jgi:hypothetical protein